LGWVGLGWVGLGWVGLGWVGLGWVRLGWVKLDTSLKQTNNLQQAIGIVQKINACALFKKYRVTQ
jgi:hypothetical protein